MSIEESIAERLDVLVEESLALTQGSEHDQVDGTQAHKCRGWLAAAVNIVQVVLTDPDSGYRKIIEEIAVADHGYMIHHAVGEVAAILANLVKDNQTGLLTSVANHARAEVLDDFLDHAEVYIRDGRKNEAGVIAGVVFEDTLRRVSRMHNISEKGMKLDDLISQLAKSNVLSATKAKRARAAADVRTRATHAQWDEFDENDAKTTIEFTKEMIVEHVDK